MIAASWDWGNLTVAGAFVAGALVGTVATLRVVRAVTGYFGAVDHLRRHPPADDE